MEEMGGVTFGMVREGGVGDGKNSAMFLVWFVFF